MAAAREDLPEEIDTLRAALLAECARAARVEAELAVARAKASDDAALIAHQRLQIEKLTRQLYGPRSERAVRLLDQMELAFEELESSASELRRLGGAFKHLRLQSGCISNLTLPERRLLAKRP